MDPKHEYFTKLIKDPKFAARATVFSSAKWLKEPRNIFSIEQDSLRGMDKDIQLRQMYQKEVNKTRRFKSYKPRYNSTFLSDHHPNQQALDSQTASTRNIQETPINPNHSIPADPSHAHNRSLSLTLIPIPPLSPNPLTFGHGGGLEDNCSQPLSSSRGRRVVTLKKTGENIRIRCEDRVVGTLNRGSVKGGSTSDRSEKSGRGRERSRMRDTSEEIMRQRQEVVSNSPSQILCSMRLNDTPRADPFEQFRKKQSILKTMGAEIPEVSKKHTSGHFIKLNKYISTHWSTIFPQRISHRSRQDTEHSQQALAYRDYHAKRKAFLTVATSPTFPLKAQVESILEERMDTRVRTVNMRICWLSIIHLYILLERMGEIIVENTVPEDPALVRNRRVMMVGPIIRHLIKRKHKVITSKISQGVPAPTMAITHSTLQVVGNLLQSFHPIKSTNPISTIQRFLRANLWKYRLRDELRYFTRVRQYRYAVSHIKAFMARCKHSRALISKVYDEAIKTYAHSTSSVQRVLTSNEYSQIITWILEYLHKYSSCAQVTANVSKDWEKKKIRMGIFNKSILYSSLPLLPTPLSTLLPPLLIPNNTAINNRLDNGENKDALTVDNRMSNNPKRNQKIMALKEGVVKNISVGEGGYREEMYLPFKPFVLSKHLDKNLMISIINAIIDNFPQIRTTLSSTNK
jgi:hypothetical protein